ncbi:MAG: site-specific integrase [Nitrospirae bacterium]|nr:site-specific integrase [Nitrospirota bacterium]
MGLYRRGKIFWFSIKYKDKRIQESLKTEKKKIAEKLYAKVLADIIEDRYFEKPKDITLNEVIDRYMREISPMLSPSSHERNNQIAAHFKSLFGNCLIKDVSPSLLSQYKAERLQKVLPSTVRKELAFLRRVFSIAIDEWELCKENPVKKVMRSLKVDNARVRYVATEEAQKLRFTLPEWLKPIVIVASQTGLRQGNILQLTLSQLDFNRNLIIVPKTKNGEPIAISMTNIVRDTLLRVLRERKIASSFVFCNELGQPHSGKKVSMAFKRACDRAGIKDLRFHDLKHDFATALVQSGVDLYRVQKLCGHKDQRMTQRYAHLLPESLREAIKVIDCKGTATILLQSDEDEKGLQAVTP